MTKRTYTLEHQRLEPGQGYVPCLPHQACRVALQEITVVPPKHGRKKLRITKVVQTFHGAGASQRAQEQLCILTRRGETGKRPRGKILFQSLTRAEYDEAVAKGLAHPEPRWRRFPPNWSTSPQGRSE